MSGVLPRQSPVDHVPQEQTDIVVHDDEPAEILQAMASDTAQEIMGIVGTEPSTASEIAEAVGTTLQNTQYHLDRLSDAGLIEGVETWYSAKGKEMTVYAPTTERLVVQFGNQDTEVRTADNNQ
ncbi:MAG: ArsR/SmtB family transcription factor [Halobacteriaceae archaeon]